MFPLLAMMTALAAFKGSGSVAIDAKETGRLLAFGSSSNQRDWVSQPTPWLPGYLTPEESMLRGDTIATGHGWTAHPLFTVSERLLGYQPPGILDGMGAFGRSDGKVDVLVSHELPPGSGYAYSLENGTQLNGARITRLRIGRTIHQGTAYTRLDSAKLAYRRVYDRSHSIVVDPFQINETGTGTHGLARMCSGQGVAAGTYGFVDQIYFAGEEAGQPGHPHGGTEWALDVADESLWAIPAMGRMAWENVTPLSTGNPGTVALLCGSDSPSAPLFLYVGQKNAWGDGSFLDRNGLRQGELFAWKSDQGDLDPEDFHGVGSQRSGVWVPLTVQDPAAAGWPGYDDLGFADLDTLQNEADALGCFSFSRPEDVATNPYDGTQAVLASTGRGALYPSDNWGMVVLVDVDWANGAATLMILHDADGLPIPDEGIRSPDNLDWGRDGKIYVQEDRSTTPVTLFGQVTGVEASVWQLDPITRAYTRVAEIERSAVAPSDAFDAGAGDIGHWESSGILDVTHLFATLPGERLLLATVQAHGIRDGSIGDNALLDEGGQLLFLSKQGP